jgi:hypothetical protein
MEISVMKPIKEPKKPSKRITVKQERIFSDWQTWDKKDALWSTFSNWANRQIPSNATDVKIGIDEDWWYDDCVSSLIISWKEETDNPDYDKEMIKYEKKLVKWNKQC